MSSLEIVYYDDPRLREKCVPVAEDDQEIAEQIDGMIPILYDFRGIGLAASQVGVMKRFFIWDVDWVETDKNDKRIGKKNLHVMINPEIIEESPQDEPFTEGCLSLPGIEGEVFRPSMIKIRYQDLKLDWHEDSLSGLAARVTQHELDHLDGVLFIDRMSFMKRTLLAGSLRKLKEEGPQALKLPQK